MQAADKATTTRAVEWPTAFKERAVVALIVVLSVGLSTFWAFRVPIFEEPDESAHFDYAISIATAHRLILAREGTPGTDVHPITRYLEDATKFRSIRYNRDGRVPRGTVLRDSSARLTPACRLLARGIQHPVACHTW